MWLCIEGGVFPKRKLIHHFLRNLPEGDELRDEANQNLRDRPQKEVDWGIFRNDDPGDVGGWTDNPQPDENL
jgi:hypothetical protein